MIIVPKPGGKIRPCLDYRDLNAITQPITFPIPRISDLLNALGSVKVITSLDLASAYHQCSISPSDRHKTAFTVKNSKYEFNRVSFGLTSAPGYFSRIINETLFEELGANLLVYLDDIILYSKDNASHMAKLEAVLKRLAEANLKIKLSKCRFFTTEVKFLGFTVGTSGMSMDPGRIEAIRAMPYPASKKQLQSFLGALNYFRLFVRNFASISEPLYALLRKNVKFDWTASQSAAVDILKEKLCSPPILKFPDYSKPFHLHSDASLDGIAGCLLQEHDGVLHPLSYVSKSLTPTQRAYSATKRELLALIFTLEQYRNTILYYEVKVYTDHRPLLGIMAKGTKDATMTRWTLLVQEYNIKLHYLPGKENLFSDVLSRLVQINDGCEELTQDLDDSLLSRINTVTRDEDSSESKDSAEQDENLNSFIPIKAPWSEAKLETSQLEDEQCKEIKDLLKRKTHESTTKLSKFRILRNLLFVHRSVKRGTLTDEFLVPYVPDSLLRSAFTVIHEQTTAGHTGYERTLRLFKRNFYHYQEGERIKALCEACELCLRAKATPKAVPLGTYPIPKRPFETVSSDILGPLPITESGNRYLIVFRDFTTRYTVILPLEYKSAESLIIALRTFISNYGTCDTLLTDNAREYVSEQFKKFCNFYNIKKVEIAPYHPQSQGISERINREINKLLRIYSNSLAPTDWDQLLPTIQLTINNTHNQSIGDTPFYCLFGFDSPTVTFSRPQLNYNESALNYHLRRIDQIRQHCRENLLKIQAKYIDTANVKRHDKEIQIGQRVYAKLDKHMSRRKLDLPISGPFQVIEKKGSAYRLQTIQGKNTYTVHSDSIVVSQAAAAREEATQVEESESTDISQQTADPDKRPP